MQHDVGSRSQYLAKGVRQSITTHSWTGEWKYWHNDVLVSQKECTRVYGILGSNFIMPRGKGPKLYLAFPCIWVYMFIHFSPAGSWLPQPRESALHRRSSKSILFRGWYPDPRVLQPDRLAVTKPDSVHKSSSSWLSDFDWLECRVYATCNWPRAVKNT